MVWVHNDSGDVARLFAVDGRGCTLEVLGLTGVTAGDWEDIAQAPAPDGTPSLWVGDIGDNGARRGSVQVVRVAEPAALPRASRRGHACPAPAARSAVPVVSTLRYPDGPHDAETLLVSPRTARIAIVTKRRGGPAVLFLAPPAASAGGSFALTDEGTIPLPRGGLTDAATGGLAITGGSIAPDDRAVVLRSYGSIFRWTLRGGGLLAALRRPPDARDGVPDPGAQGEGIAFTRRGNALLTDAEGRGAAVFEVPIP